MYLLETGKAPCWQTGIQVRLITIVYTIFRSPKTISAQTTLNSIQQFHWFDLYDGQSREEDKDQELIHDAARHCPV